MFYSTGSDDSESVFVQIIAREKFSAGNRKLEFETVNGPTTFDALQKFSEEERKGFLFGAFGIADQEQRNLLSQDQAVVSKL